jgi:hypothetical protein
VLFQRLVEVLGDREASTLMEHLLTAMIYRELAAQTRTFVLATLGAVVSVGGLAVGAARG